MHTFLHNESGHAYLVTWVDNPALGYNESMLNHELFNPSNVLTKDIVRDLGAVRSVAICSGRDIISLEVVDRQEQVHEHVLLEAGVVAWRTAVRGLRRPGRVAPQLREEDSAHTREQPRVDVVGSVWEVPLGDRALEA